MEAENAVKEAAADSMNSSFLYEKINSAFESMSELIVNRLTYQRFVELTNREDLSYYERASIKGYIHQLRQCLRADFRQVFEQTVAKYKIKEAVRTISLEIEKEKVIKELDEVTSQLLSKGPEYYFQFLLRMVHDLKAANAEATVAQSESAPVEPSHN